MIARLATAIVFVLAACVHTPVVVYHPDILEIVQTDSDMAVQVVSDERIATHEPRAVEADAVAQALIGSGQFLDDAARSLAAPVSRRLATMQVDESIRIVGWSADAARYYYVVVHDGKLRVTSYLGEHRTDDHTAVIPTPAEAIVAPKDPVAPPTDAGVPEAAPPPDAAPAPAPTPMPMPAPKRVKRGSIPEYKPISEAEARKRIAEIDAALQAGLITATEHRTKRKEVLARL